ncbi:unnamed protein product [Ambrosiozyma monospora]|uniref:Unnamed protein product n=1 Tax=Ambrosiozyma monospora TaxID=43982 RepID=A0ACB5U3I1_AMBMO|nr:unnamed protein product [Ambrosiozyma monospora]
MIATSLNPLFFCLAAITSSAPIPQINIAKNETNTPIEKRAYTGRASYFTPSFGACGTISNEDEMVVALPISLYQAKAKTTNNVSGYCGKHVKVSWGGKSTTATVVDKGMLGESDLDLSPAAFQALGSLDHGVLENVQWNFVD